MKKKTKNLIRIIFYPLFIIAALAWIISKNQPPSKELITVSTQEAVGAAQAFCKKFNLACSGLPIMVKYFPVGFLSKVGPNHYSVVHAFHSYSNDPHGLYICYGDNEIKSAKDIEDRQPVCFVIGNTKEVGVYANQSIHSFQYRKYYSKSLNRAIWPEFMSEAKARKILIFIASKLSIPDDMVFDRMEKNEEWGVWNTVWLRKTNGYIFEGDAISISIMGQTGEFIGYTKTYRGVPCPTEVKISKEQALNVGWEKLRRVLPWKIKNKAKDIYKTESELMIIQTNKFGKSSIPAKLNGSRLSWVVKYNFTGGLEPLIKMEDNESDEVRKQRKAELKTFILNRQAMGDPPQAFQVRIDAATGEILYVSDVPWYERWFK
jgi:hypothetical protein